MTTEQLKALNAKGYAFTVLDALSGLTYGNHTYSEACARAQKMTIAWQYKKKFKVIEIGE